MFENNKIALLKEISQGFSENGEVRGVARQDGKTLNLSIINLKKGNYFICYFFNDQLKRCDLPSCFGGEIDIEKPLKSILLAIENENGIVPVIYGKFIENGESWESIVKYAQKQNEKVSERADEDAIFQKEEYDDEAVATYNYFERDKRGLVEDDNQTKGDGVYCREDKDDRKETQDGNQTGAGYDENSFGTEYSDGEKSRKPFISKIMQELEPIFKTHPSEENLMQMVEGGRWVKVTVENGKHYVVGVINKNGSPKYICYGLPGDFYSPPQEICGYKSFIPLSPFDLKGKGYWVMYQDAITGKGL